MNIKPHLKSLLILVFFLVFGYQNKLTAQIPNYIPTDSLVAWWPFNGNANDESGNGNHGTINGATLTNDRFGNKFKAYYFSLFDYISTNNIGIGGTNGRTISFWLKNQYSDRTLTPISYGGGGNWYGTVFGIKLNRNYKNDQCGCWPTTYEGAGIDGAHMHLIYNTSIGDSVNWHHYVYVSENSNSNFQNVKIYKDGLLISLSTNIVFDYNNNSSSVSLNTNISNNYPLIFGKSEANSSSLGSQLDAGETQYLDDISIWNRALSSNEIKALFYANFNQWSGTGNFTSTSNWISGNVPTSSDSIHVTSGTLTINQNTSLDVLSLFNGSTVKLSAPLTVRNLYLKNGTIDLNGQKLTVTGRIFHSTDSSTYYIQAGTSASPKPRSELVISSSTAQNSTVYFNPNANRINRFEIGNGTAASSITLGNSLKIKGGEDGGSGPGLLTIKKNSKIIIPSGSVLTLESDTFNAGLSLSDPAKRAIICQGTGKFAIEREHYGARGWRLYSHPFNANIDLQQVADDIEVIGFGGTSEGFFSNTYTNSSVYWYDYSKADSTVSTDPAWTPFTSAKGTTISGNSNLWNKTSPILLFNPGAVRGSGAFSNPSSATYQEGKITLTYGLDSTGVHLNDGEIKEISTNVPDYIPSNGLVGYWPFNGNANDESGNGNHGKVNGASLTTDRNGNSNSAYSFDGNDDAIKINEIVKGDFTLSVWYYTENQSTSGTPNGLRHLFYQGVNEFTLQRDYIGNQFKIVAGIKLANNTYYFNSQNNSTIQKNAIWTHLIMQYKAGKGIYLFINGNLSDSSGPTPNLNLWTGGANTTSIGSYHNGYHWWDGKLDDIAIWNRALTPSEITALYNGTTTTKLSSKSQYYFITNPFTTPVKLNRISGLNSTNCHSYFYYWKQRRNAISNNFMPAMWQSELISNGNTDRDTNISIPAFGTILVKLKNPSVAFSIPESAKQLTNFNYIIGGARGTSSQGLMFQEIPLPKQGPGAIEIELLINDSLPVDRILVYDKSDEINTFGGADAPKYKDPSFANIYSITSDGKSLSLDAQDIGARLNSGEDKVEIPLVIDRDLNKTQKNLRLRIWEKHTDLQCYFKDSKSGNLTPAESFSDIAVEFSGSDASTHRYSLVFKRSSTSTKDFKDDDLARGGKLKPEVIIYPNPANDLLHVRVLNGSGKLNYEIYSITGVKVLKGSLDNSQKININTLEPGIYIMVAGGQKVKFVKE